MFLRIFFRLLAVFCAITLAGCSVYNIEADSSDSKNSIPGVPFYVKTTQLVQTTRFARVWNVVTLTVTWQGQDGKPASKPFSFNIDPNTDIAELRLWSPNNTASADDIAKEVRDKLKAMDVLLSSDKLHKEIDITFENCPNNDQDNEAAVKSWLAKAEHVREEFLSNQVDKKTVVDYSRKYYFNVCAPLFGTADANIELKDDGTLGKGGGKISMEKLGDIFPLKEILLDKWGITVASGAESFRSPQAAPVVTKIDISVKETGREYVLTKKWPLSQQHVKSTAPLKVCDALNGEADIKVLNFASASSSHKKKDNSKAIKIAGSIQMPK